MLLAEPTLLPSPINLRRLLDGQVVESERIEFKQGWNPLSVLHTLCAFANDFHNLGGGYILIGIAEKNGVPVFPPVGLDSYEINMIQKELLQLSHESIRPNFHPTVALCDFDGATVLLLRAQGGLIRPYKARLSLAKDGHDWGYFIRKGSSTVRAKDHDEIELLSLASTIPFDDLINQRAQVSDLSRELIRAYLVEVKSDLASHVDTLDPVVLGRQMNIVTGPTEDVLPINVGLLFFNPEPWRFFPVAQIDVVWFPEGPGGDNFTEKIFRGPIHHMTREALDYIRRNYLNETVIKHRDRAEATHVENFPYVAIEETLINAIYHRSYQEREPVEVRIGIDEMIVLSYPGPDRSVRLDELRAGRASPRRYRNRRIGEFLKELELTEGRCTGIPKIIHAMRENGSPPPVFEFDEHHNFCMVRLPVHPLARPPMAAFQTDQVTPQVGDQVRGQVGDQVESQVAKLIRVVAGEMSRLQIQAALGLKGRRHFREDYLIPALSAGLVEMTVPTAPNSRLQKYRLTQKGRMWLAARDKGMRPNLDTH
jgi:ATP-dependent DNA helicase RecG